MLLFGHRATGREHEWSELDSKRPATISSGQLEAVTAHCTALSLSQRQVPGSCPAMPFPIHTPIGRDMHECCWQRHGRPSHTGARKPAQSKNTPLVHAETQKCPGILRCSKSEATNHRLPSTLVSLAVRSDWKHQKSEANNACPPHRTP